MSVFDRPSAANRIAFARTTSRYGPEYAAARRSSSRRCSSLKTTRCGEVCAIAHQNSPAPSQSLQPFAAYFRRRPLRPSTRRPGHGDEQGTGSAVAVTNFRLGARIGSRIRRGAASGLPRATHRRRGVRMRPSPDPSGRALRDSACVASLGNRSQCRRPPAPCVWGPGFA